MDSREAQVSQLNESSTENSSPRMARKGHLTITAIKVLAAVFCGVMCSYVMGYFLLIVPTPEPLAPLLYKMDTYRWGGRFSLELFYPMHILDRHLRPEVWGSKNPDMRYRYELLPYPDKIGIWARNVANSFCQEFM